jgi:hypothetical protein
MNQLKQLLKTLVSRLTQPWVKSVPPVTKARRKVKGNKTL